MHDERRPQHPAAELIARLEESRRSLMDAIAGLDEDGFRSRPRQGEWNAAEVLAHLFSVERARLDQVRMVLAQDHAFVRWIDDEELDREARAAAKRMPVPQIVHGLLALRRDVITLLEPLGVEQLARPYEHERRGEHTAGWLLYRMAEHEREHADQVRALRGQAAVGEP